MIRTRQLRRGFTLVELLVASAMCILGMWLCTWLYQQALDSFRQARAQADLTAQERMAVTVLARDLRAPHFLDEDNKPNNGRRLSDQTLGFLKGAYTPPRGGFFWAKSRQPGAWEVDPIQAQAGDGFTSTRSTDHALQFTVLLPGGSNFQQFSAEVPAGAGSQNMWYGTAAEVSYHLVQTGLSPTDVPLHNLVRRQRLVARTTDDATAYNADPRQPAQQPNASEVMVVSGTPLQMQTLSALTVPFTTNNTPPCVRLPLPPPVNQMNAPPAPPYTFSPIAPSSVRYGEDVLLSNVISFEVKFTGPPMNVGAGAWPLDPPSTQWPRPMFPTTAGAQPNSDYPYDNLPFNGEFETFSTQVPSWNAPTNYASSANPNGMMKPLRITGVQIRLRVWDPKTRATRQTTMIQDL